VSRIGLGFQGRHSTFGRRILPVAANSLRSQHASKLVRSFETMGRVCDGIAAVGNMGVAGKDAFADS
jgi:hypothetical protein